MDLKPRHASAWAALLLAAAVLAFGPGPSLRAQSVYTPCDFTTLAGIYGSNNGPGASVRLSNPVGIARDAHGNLLVSEWTVLTDYLIFGGSGYSAVLKISPTDAVATLAGGSYAYTLAPFTGAGPVLGFPTSLAVAANGNVYFVNSTAIGKISPQGMVSSLAGSVLGGTADGTGSAARFGNLGGLAADGGGNLYAVDTDNETIREIAPGGVVTTVAGTVGVGGSADGLGSAARFKAPTGIAIDSAGNLYITDTGNYTVRVMAPGGTVTTLAGVAGITGTADGTGSAARFGKPTALTVDGNGNVYVADLGRIRKIAPGGIVTTVATTTDTIGYSFDATGLVADGSGNIYAVDGRDSEILAIAPGGAVTLVAGVAGGTGSADGTGAAARFNVPSGVAVDASGNTYVADTRNSTIRKIEYGGTVSTLAGSAGVLGSADGRGSAASFYDPCGVAVDAAGNVYVADSGNAAIRKISSAGVVTTLAGSPAYAVAIANGESANGESVSTTLVPGNPTPIPLFPINGGNGGDGTGSAAQFGDPAGLAVDSAGNIYVADSGYDSIRKVTPAGVVTTLAGTPGTSGIANGTGSAAQFNSPSGVAVDTAGNLYVADTGNDTIRMIAPGGIVSTLAGSPGHSGHADGVGSGAQFSAPGGVSVDTAGNVYVADTGNNLIRMIAPGGVVTTLGGGVPIPPAPAGGADGIGSAAQFNSPSGVAVDAAGNVYIADADNNTIRVGAPAAGPSVATEPSFLSQPSSQTLAAGGTMAFSVASDTIPAPSYQWWFDGVAIPGATNSTLLLTGVTSANAGEYYCVATNSLGAATAAATLAVVATSTPGYLTTLSGRGMVGGGPASGLFGGFSISGSGAKQLLIRGIGPSLALAPFDLSGALSDPQLTLENGAQAMLGQNHGWGGGNALMTADAAVGAFPIPTNSLDSMLYPTPLAPGNYSAAVSGIGGATGIAMVEFYDADTSPPPAQLTNLSVRAPVGPGANLLIGGFSIGGNTSETVLIRAIGPSLSLPPFNLTGSLAQPVLSLFNSGQQLLDSNTGWGGNPTLASIFATIGAYALPAGSQDSALLVTLPPGDYTAQITGVNGGTGIATVEIYAVP